MEKATEKLFFPVILGTARIDRKSEAVAKYVFTEAKEREDIETELVDVKDHAKFPTTPPWGKGGADEQETAWKRIALRADGFVIVSPEYNHGYPGELKLLLDSLYNEYEGKPVALCGVSAGTFGGTRLVDHIKPVLIELNMVPIREALYVPKAGELFSEDGSIADSGFANRAQKVLDALVSYARALRARRIK